MLPASTKKALVQSIATSTALIKHVQAATNAPLAAAKIAVVGVEAAAEVAVEGVAVEGANQYCRKFAVVSVQFAVKTACSGQ